MGKTWIAVAVVAAGACGWLGRSAFSEDPPADHGMSPELQKKLEELATPGEHHKWLASQEGEWTLTSKMMGPDGKMQDVPGTASIRMLLGGRFQEQRLKTTMHGMPFEGFGITGYDNDKKEFVNYWFDNMGTSPAISRGQRSADGKTLSLNGGWEVSGFAMTMNMVSTVKSATEMGFVMNGTMNGQPMPPMETTYTKKASTTTK